MNKKRVIIMGAGGRDFHNFLTYFKKNNSEQVIAFTATQIPGIDKRVFPKKLAGAKYPKGIKIYPEKDIKNLIEKFKVDEVVFAYSDISNQELMEKAAKVLSYGVDFKLMGLNKTTIKSKKPVIAITAVRTGAGKSPTTKKISVYLKEKGFKTTIIRHPMPYGNLNKQEVQRFETLKDLDKHKCTFEEREEYEPHIRNKIVVYAGIDYEKIVRAAEKESDVIIWDGGNNDLTFIKQDFQIVITDARRAGHEIEYYPGFTNFLNADAIIINKVKTASKKDIQIIKSNIQKFNPKAKIIKTDMKKVLLDNVDKSKLKNKKILAVEDGPTTTHGGMPFGAAALFAESVKAKLVDPRPYAVGSIKKTFEKYPHLSEILPAMGYGKKQMREIEKTINKSKADIVLIGTPTDIRRLLKINKPAYKVDYSIEKIGEKSVEDLIKIFIKKNLKNK